MFKLIFIISLLSIHKEALADIYSPQFECSENEAIPLIEQKAQDIAESTCQSKYTDLSLSMISIHTQPVGATHYFIKFKCEKLEHPTSAVLTATPQDFCSKVSYKLVNQPLQPASTQGG